MESKATTMFKFVVISMVIAIAMAADPDPPMDFQTGVNNFVLRNIFKNGDVTNDSGGIRAATSIQNFPGLQMQALSLIRFKAVPCGVNPPHTHPRASEVLSLISGGPLQVGFVDTNGTTHIDIIYPGDVTVFPRGTIHFELNVGKKQAEYISALNSQNPGTLEQSEALFALPMRAAATAFNIDLGTLKKLNSTIYKYSISLKLDPKSGCVPGKDITTTF